MLLEWNIITHYSADKKWSGFNYVNQMWDFKSSKVIGSNVVKVWRQFVSCLLGMC